MKNSNMMPLLTELMNQNLTFDFNLNDSSNLTEIDNDYVQYQIYNEVRRNNSFIELWRHIFGISGCLISLFGIFGNILSIIILLKPASTNEQLTKYLNERNQSHHNRRSLGSFEHKLASFYAYLTALSFCDLFSCIFSILNMLEYIPPPYLDWSFNSEQYREFYLSISVYTHPIATTLQALSVWIVCAFSVHRCRSIINPSNYLSSSMKNGEKPTEASARNYFCRINLKNNCSHQTYELKFYTKAWQYLQHKLCLYCFCTFTPHYSVTTECDFTKPAYDVVHIVEPSEAEPERPIVRRPSQVVRTSTTIRKVNKARWVIFVLYVLALIYLIPQMFEKRLSYIEIHHKTYVFTTITEFGQQRWFRQIFHLWFYIIAIYIFPFLLILIFNLLLLRTYLISKKRVQRYKLRTDPNKILRDYNSNVGINGNINEELPRSSISMASKMNRANSSFCEVASTTTTTTVPLMCKQDQQLNQPLSNIQHRIQNFRRRSSARIASMKLDSKGRALTLTLLGVAIIFFICHFPAAIAKVIYVLYPRIEFEQKSRFASICLDISNFLIMVNSSINFLLYIVFGPGKFRQEFSLLCHRLFGRCGLVKHNTYKNSIVNFNTTNAEYSSCYRAGGGPKKCSITISENNFNMNTSRVANSIFESNERNDSGPLEELNV